jgi:hypothetical protein
MDLMKILVLAAMQCGHREIFFYEIAGTTNKEAKPSDCVHYHVRSFKEH